MGMNLGRFKPQRNEEWLDWLTDDPIPPSIRQKMRSKAVADAAQPIVHRAGQPTTLQQPVQPTSDTKTVSINITVPKIKLKKPEVRLPHVVQRRKPQIVGGLAVAAVIIGVGTVTLLNVQSSDPEGSAPAVLAESNEKASFEYTLPKGEVDTLDTPVRYDGQKKVVNYQDNIGGVPITISQQQLPEGFKEDTDTKVKKLAEDFSATKTIATANPTAYIGTSEKGPQTVIFSKNDLLIFIQSTKKIDDYDWAEYITNLK